MLVEDDEAIRFIAVMALEIGGFRVIECESGLAALQKVPNEQVDLVLCDMMMPGMNGLELMARLRANPGTQHLPVVFLTARVMEDDIREYIDRGAADVIVKPFDSNVLPVQLRAIWQAL